MTTTYIHESMRLLQCNESGELSFHSFDDGVIPAYAILSHTWGNDGDEVTFADLKTGEGRTKLGYEKIIFCGKRARHDGLQYFWIDACCIDTTDKAEHSLAIQSMFRWYRSAAKCYVYLSDVSVSADGLSSKSCWESAFRSSRWFTRGWTLQEFLAPTIVEFYSQEGEMLGDKVSLMPLVRKATGIPLEVLDGAPLSRFSSKERLRWKGDRETKRDEDAWYSLAGIFDVEIAPAYSEGAASAFKRLMDEVHKLERCIQGIRQTDPRDDKKRIEDTTGGLLEGSYRWVLSNSSFLQWYDDRHGQLLWIKGDPGKGKTMLLCGIIDELQKTVAGTASVTYFFCQATDSRINSATAVLRGLLYLLVSQQPAVTRHVRKRYDQAGRSIFEDANAWVVLTEIFADVLQDLSLDTTYVLIDALDECVTDLPKLLSFVAQQSSASSRVKWIVSSRNWPSVEEQLEQAGHKIRLSLELNAESVSGAVSVFIQHKVSQLAQQKRYNERTLEAIFKHLISNANDTFLWVALVCRELEKTARWNVLKKLNSFPPGLDALYERMIQQTEASDGAELCKQVLASIALVYRPITLRELMLITEALEDIVEEADVRNIIGLCGSFLTLQEDTVYLVHQSAQDFLLVKVSDKVFPDGIEAAHGVVFSRSLAILSRTLYRDMYGFKAPGISINDVEPPVPDPLVASRYACVYWIDHLCDSKFKSRANASNDSQETRIVGEFIKKKYLYWLEGLSLCRSVAKGVISMQKLCSLSQGDEELTKLFEDARRFILYHKGPIENYPLQIYASALLFSPTESAIRKCFQHEEPEKVTVKPAMSSSWSACLQTLEGHTDVVYRIAVSHDSAWLASASYDHTIRIWDAASGTCLHTLKGHTEPVYSIAFSCNSVKLASASADDTAKIWDTNSGLCLQTLECCSSYYWCTAFSHNLTRLAIALHGGAVEIWDIDSGMCLQTLENHEDVSSTTFSHDLVWLASASGDYHTTIRIWDASSGACLHTLKAHSANYMCLIRSLAFSHDSTWLASASEDNTVKIWDTRSWSCLQTLNVNGGFVNSVAISHDSSWLATASEDSFIMVWDTSTWRCLQILKSHSGQATSVAFSHDSTWLASASWDWTVKIWDVSIRGYLNNLEDYGDSVTAIAFSHDLTQLASASEDGSLKTWDVSSGARLQTFIGHRDGAEYVAFSYDSVRLASTSYDDTLRLWDVSSGVCITVTDHNRSNISRAFSHDSTKLASASNDHTIKLLNVSDGACIFTFRGHDSHITSITFSHDSTRLASASVDGTVSLWDVGNGACLLTFRGSESHITSSVAFSRDLTLLASASYDKIIEIWNTSNQTCLYILNVDRLVKELSFNSTASYLYTETGTIDIQSLAVSGIENTAKPQRPLYVGIGISADRTWIQYAGENILWIPSEYRPSCTSVKGSTIGIGAGSGRVWFCSIDSMLARSPLPH